MVSRQGISTGHWNCLSLDGCSPKFIGVFPCFRCLIQILRMNPLKIAIAALCISIAQPVYLSGEEPIRIFYELGNKLFEVKSMKLANPVLDTPVDGDIERARFESGWSIAGELPLNSEYTSRRVDYQFKRMPKPYAQRNSDDNYVAFLRENRLNRLGWKGIEDTGVRVLFGWLNGNEIEDVFVSSKRGLTWNPTKHKTIRSDLSQKGILVAWLVGSDGALIPRNNEVVASVPLQIAALNGDIDTLSNALAADKKALQIEDEDEGTLLMYAARGGRLDVSRYLLENGVKPFSEDQYRAGALEKAGDGGWLEIVQLIASEKSKGSAQKLQYSIAAVNAFNDGYDAIALHLLERGAKIDIDRKNAPDAAMQR